MKDGRLVLGIVVLCVVSVMLAGCGTDKTEAAVRKAYLAFVAREESRARNISVQQWDASTYIVVSEMLDWRADRGWHWYRTFFEIDHGHWRRTYTFDQL